MKKVNIVILLIMIGFSALAESTIGDNKALLAEITPSPAKIVSGYKSAKEGVQTTFTYNEDSMYTVYTRVNYITSILLQPGESITFVGGGDTGRWRRANATTGSSEGEREVVYIKPTSIGLKTNLIINTNKRSYQINLISDKALYNPSIKWQYPEDEMMAQIERKEALRKKESSEERIADITDLNYNYTLDTNKHKFSPVQVFDDNQKTYIILKEDLQEMPVLYVVDGKNSYLVNYRVKGRHIIVDRLFNKAELVLDRKKVVIKKKN